MPPHKQPKFQAPTERAWYEYTPKRVIYEIMLDFAIRIVGENLGVEHAIKEVRTTQRILRDNHII